jgi:hypothetical protein
MLHKPQPDVSDVHVSVQPGLQAVEELLDAYHSRCEWPPPLTLSSPKPGQPPATPWAVHRGLGTDPKPGQ